MLNPEAETVSWLRFAFASFTVLGLLALTGWGLRVVASRGWFLPKTLGQARLSCVASLAIDARHRVVIVRKDESEYFLLLGPNQDLLLAQTAVRGGAAQPPNDSNLPDDA